MIHRSLSLCVAFALLSSMGAGCREDSDEVKANVTAAPVPVANTADPGATDLVKRAAKALPTKRVGQAGPLPLGHSRQLPPGHPSIDTAAGAPEAKKLPGLDGPKGKVQQRLQAGRYTYLQVNGSWCAVTATDVSVGDEVAIVGAMKMKNFTSKATGKVFAEVWFGHLARPRSSVAAPTAKAAPAKVVSKLTGSQAKGALTVAQLHSQRQALVGRRVRVTGRVVKTNTGILGRSWVHLQDGTGDEKLGTHDVTLTMSSLNVHKGDEVTLSGVVAVDRDFGSGYRYPVLLEEAAKASP